MTTRRPGHTCSCGRTGLRAGGWVSHRTACPIEQARSAAFVASIERGATTEETRAACDAAVRDALRARAAESE